MLSLLKLITVIGLWKRISVFLGNKLKQPEGKGLESWNLFSNDLQKKKKNHICICILT